MNCFLVNSFRAYISGGYLKAIAVKYSLFAEISMNKNIFGPVSPNGEVFGRVAVGSVPVLFGRVS